MDQVTRLTVAPEIEFNLQPKDGPIEKRDPLELKIDDQKLVDIIDDRLKASLQFYEEHYDLTNRRRRNEIYLFGRQIDEKERKNELKDYEGKYLDNALYEIEETIVPLAFAQLPDLIVTPGNPSDESRETAENVTSVIDNEPKKRENRRVLKSAFRHLPVYYTGVIKVRWDPSKGEHGDYIFESRHPDNIVADHRCTTNNADDMSYIAEYLPITVQDCVMRFPEAKQDLFEQLRNEGVIPAEGEPTWKQMASMIKIVEIWFDWNEPADGEDKEKWEKVSGVMWKYKKVLLKKMKNPNYDWEGEKRWFTSVLPTDEESKKEVLPGHIQLASIMGVTPPNIRQEQVYHNYFEFPRKPYFFMGYDQWGKIPYDETSRIEQNIKNQQTMDKRGKQIEETLNNRGHHIYSKDSGLKADDVERIDMNNPNQDLLVDGDVNKVHEYLTPPRPTPDEFKDLNDVRQRMYAISGSTAIRGNIQSDVATTNQIAREADYTRADDLVEDTINAACEWMAQWAMQMIKLRYTKEHFRKLLGAKGEVTFVKLNRDMIEDGMEVMVKTSTSDKIKAQRNAMDTAKLGPPYTNPLDFFRDMGMNDPELRTAKGIAFASNPLQYLAEFVKQMGGIPQLAQQLPGQMPQTPPPPEAPTIIQQPQQPTPVNTSAVPTQPPVGVQASPSNL